MTDRDVIDANVDLIDERLALLREERENFNPDDSRAFVRQIYAHGDGE